MTSSPVAVSIAEIRSTRSGQSCDGSRCAITSRRTASVTVAVDSATAPIFCSFSAVVVFGVNIAVTNSSVISSTPTSGLSSVDDVGWSGGRTARRVPGRCPAERRPSSPPTCRPARRRPAGLWRSRATRRRCPAECPSPTRCPPARRRRAPTLVSLPRQRVCQAADYGSFMRTAHGAGRRCCLAR